MHNEIIKFIYFDEQQGEDWGGCGFSKTNPLEGNDSLVTALQVKSFGNSVDSEIRTLPHTSALYLSKHLQ